MIQLNEICRLAGKLAVACSRGEIETQIDEYRVSMPRLGVVK